MKKNLGQVDRLVRLFAGLVIVIVATMQQSWWGLVGVALIATAGMGYCGLYQLFGFSTCKVELPTTPVAPATPVKPVETTTNPQPPVTPQQ
jgi:hypothetical protein